MIKKQSVPLFHADSTGAEKGFENIMYVYENKG